MKTTRIILLTVSFIISSIFASDAVILPKTVEIAGQNIKKGNIHLNLESKIDIYGVQFDLKYDPQELNLVESGIVSKVPGIEIYSSIKEHGNAIVLMFSMSGEKVLDVNISNITEILEINFDPVNMFNGTSTVELDDIIIAGKGGEQATAAPRAVFDVTYYSPQKTSLSKNYPNPFNPSTTIDYQLSKEGIVSLVVYDLKGSEIKTLIQEHQGATYHNIIWNGLNNNGQPVASGRYLLKMTAPGFTETITMTLLK